MYYVDFPGKGSPRLYGRHRKLLPNPRDIRLQIHEKSLPIHELGGHSHFLMLWGQKTSHDLIEKMESKCKLFLQKSMSCLQLCPKLMCNLVANSV